MFLLSFNITDSSHFLKNKLKINDENLIKIIEDNTQSVLRTLEHHEVSATFFIAENLVEKLEDLIKQIYKEHHEIAVFAHDNNLQSIIAAKDKILGFIGKSVKGIRMQNVMLPSKDLQNIGFSYVSPIEKIKITYLFRRLERKTEIYSEENLQIVPESIAPYTQIPYNESVFQYLPMKYYQNMMMETLKNEEYVLIYLNMLQFTDFETNNLRINFLRKYNTGRKMTDKLEALLNFVNDNDLAVSLLKDYLL
jgi:hypothetical protein